MISTTLTPSSKNIKTKNSPQPLLASHIAEKEKQIAELESEFSQKDKIHTAQLDRKKTLDKDVIRRTDQLNLARDVMNNEMKNVFERMKQQIEERKIAVVEWEARVDEEKVRRKMLMSSCRYLLSSRLICLKYLNYVGRFE
jgi:hypothetical protein